MKVGDRVQVQSADRYNGLVGKIVGIEPQGLYPYAVDLGQVHDTPVCFDASELCVPVVRKERSKMEEKLRIRLEGLGYSRVTLDNNEVYVGLESRMVRLGFLAEVARMTDAAIACEVEAELTSQEENEEAGWA